MRSVWILALFLHLIMKTVSPASNTNSTSISSECVPPKMKCETGECIPKERICDGFFDCPTEEDEMNCSVMEEKCPSGHSKCSHGNICLPNILLCDGEYDCFDGSDETYCESHKTKYSCNSSDSFVCKSKGMEQKVCLPQNATCNGIKQCPLGDDEDGCDVLKSCAVQEHKCHHFCEDRPGSFVCGCAEGYKLDSDGRSCRYETEASSAGYLITASEDKVYKIPLADFNNGTEYSVIHISERGTVRSIDYMRQNEQTFMMIMHPNSTREELAVLSNGQMKILRENIKGDHVIAVDWIGKNVFFTQTFFARSDSNATISVCTINGLFCRRIIERKADFTGLVVHPMRGLIVFISLHEVQFHIMMANMDGSKVRYLIKGKADIEDHIRPFALAIDNVKNDVYFVDDFRNLIERINIDTKKRHIVYAKRRIFTFAMVYLNGFLYWADWNTNSITALEVANNHSSPHVVHRFESIPHGIAVNHSLHQIEPSLNPCHELDCPWLCIIIPKSSSGGITAKCICPDGYTPSGDTCIPFSPFDEMEILKNYSHIGFELMSEYCKRGIGCKNGGSCRQIFNQTRIVCDCKLPFDGQYCERTNPEMHVALKKYKTQFGAFAFLSICILVLLIVGFGALVKFAKKKLNTTSSPPDLIDDIATTPLVNKLRKIVSKERKTTMNEEGIRMENLPTSFNNPSFDETTNAPIASITTPTASFSTTIRFEDEGSLL